MTFEEQFNEFIKKWCGSNYPHLIDTDENDGQRLRDYFEEHCLDNQKVKEAIHGSVLSMSKFREGEIKEALQEYIDILYERLNLE